MTQRVVLVRHALSVPDPDVDSTSWSLAEDAHADCVRLADTLDVRPAFVYASGERKAVDTATVLADAMGAEVRVDARFREVERPYTHGDYRSVAMGYLRDGNDDWEPREAVTGRFASAIDDVRVPADEPLIVVNHGLAMSLYVASVTQVDVVSFWTSLTFPDAWSLDRSTGALARLFTEGRPAPDQT